MKSTNGKTWSIWVVIALIIAAGGIVLLTNKNDIIKTDTPPIQNQDKATPEESDTDEDKEKKDDKMVEGNEINTLFNVKEVAGKSLLEVNKILGEPYNSKKGIWHWSHSGHATDHKHETNYILNTYHEGKADIMFLDGKANRIRFHLSDIESLTSHEINKILTYVGLLGMELDSQSHNTYSIYDFEGFFEVSIKTSETGETTILLITEEKYK